MGPLWRELPVSRTFFYISLGFPNKQGLLIKVNFTFLSKPQYRTIPCMVPNRALVEKDAPSRVFLYISFMIPSKGPPLARFPLQSFHRERHSVS
jgi:hypothetical protein